MTKPPIRTLAGAASALLLLSVQAFAADTDRVRAEAYFNAISGGNSETIASFYAENAEFHWVGGPLAGTYTGKAQIKDVWERFSKAAGDIDYKVVELSESKKGKRSTVTARVNFVGPKEVPVRFVMIYENGKIVNEIWEVDKPVTDYPQTEAKAEAPPPALAQETAGQPKAAVPEVGGRNAPPKEERVQTAATSQPEPPAQANSVSVSEQANAKEPQTKGTPTPLPPAFVTTPPTPAKRAAITPPPKKRYAEKKKEPKAYRQRDDDYSNDDDYEDYSDSRYSYYGRPYRFYGGYDGYDGYGGYRGYGRYDRFGGY